MNFYLLNFFANFACFATVALAASLVLGAANVIPNMIKECTADYPNIKVVMGEPLGVDPRLADILVDRITGQ